MSIIALYGDDSAIFVWQMATSLRLSLLLSRVSIPSSRRCRSRVIFCKILCISKEWNFIDVNYCTYRILTFPKEQLKILNGDGKHGAGGTQNLD